MQGILILKYNIVYLKRLAGCGASHEAPQP